MKISFLILIIFIFLIKSIKSVDEDEGERILSRPRRYLTFPEGSSLQLGEFNLFERQTKNKKIFNFSL